MKTTWVAAAALMVGSAFAQYGPGGPGNAGGGVGLDLAQVVTVEGKVTALAMNYGAQYPAMTVDQKQIRLAPVWFLLESDFELSTGDQVKVTAARSLRTGDNYLYAITVEKGAQKIVLRDAAGIPQWTGGNGQGGSQGQRTASGAATGTGCVDPASIVTATGAVDDVSVGYGIQMPRLVLNVGTESKTIKLGPERVLLGQDFPIAKGDKLTVKYGLATCSEEYVALTVSNGERTITLRNDDGTPAW